MAAEGGFHPIAESPAISSQANVVGRHFQFQSFANELHSVWIGLQKADVRMAHDGEIGFRELVRQVLQIGGAESMAPK